MLSKWPYVALNTGCVIIIIRSLCALYPRTPTIKAIGDSFLVVLIAGLFVLLGVFTIKLEISETEK